MSPRGTGHYVTTLNDICGPCITVFSETFEEMLTEGLTMHQSYGEDRRYVITFGNKDNADVDSNGLTKMERERLQEAEEAWSAGKVPCEVCDIHGEVIVGWRPASLYVPKEAIYETCPFCDGTKYRDAEVDVDENPWVTA